MKADSRYYRILRGQEKPKNAVDGFIYRFWLNNFASPSKIWFYTGEQMAAWIESTLDVDDVHVKNLKVFEREL